MTYKEYDNVFITSSRTPCPSPLPPVGDTCELRTTPYMEVETPVRDASTIIGNSTLIDSTNSDQIKNNPYAGIVRNGHYIYIFWYDDYNGISKVIEYDINTNNKNELEIFNNFDYSIYYFELSFIVDRKVFVYSGASYPEDPNMYIADFDTMSVTTELVTDKYPYFSFTKYRGDNNVWLYCIGYTNDSTGYIIYYKNYTQQTAWNSVTGTITDGTGYIQATCFIADKYLLVQCQTKIGDGGAAYVGRFNLDTFELNESNQITKAYGDSDYYYAQSYYDGYITPDHENEHAYICNGGDGWAQINPALYNYGLQWLRYNPQTNVLSEIARDYKHAVPAQEFGGNAYSSNNRCYIEHYTGIYSDPVEILDAETLVSYGSAAVPHYGYSFFDYENNGPSYWLINQASYQFKGYTLSGTLINNISLNINQDYNFNSIDFQVAKDILIVYDTRRNNSTSTDYYYLYIIT